MFTAIFRAKDNPILGPLNGGIVELEPRHAEDDWIMTEACDVELDAFGMGPDHKLQGDGFLGDGTGRNEAAVCKFKVLWRGLESEVDRVGVSKRRIDEGSGSARVDQRVRWDRGVAGVDSDRQDDIFLGFWATGR